MATLSTKYGRWALVAGGSSGMGGEYATRLASEGFDVVVVSHDDDEVRAKCHELEDAHGVQTLGVTQDLGADDAASAVIAAVGEREIGFLVYNAGLAGIGLFEELSVERELYRLNVNVRTMLELTLQYARPMVARGRGAIILMSSGGGAIGTPYIQTYSATKAYALALGEALWGEYHGTGVDVLAVLPGNTIGNAFADVPPGTPGFQVAAEVVAEAFDALGTGPTVVTGEHNRATLAPYFRDQERRAAIEQRGQEMQEIARTYGRGA